MAAVGELLITHEAQIGFMHKGRGLERLAGRLLRQLVGRQLSQFVIDQRQQFRGGVRIALLNGR
jgi:hypothetical protein